MLAPPGFWVPDFDHMSLTGLIGLPAPGYALSDVKPPPPLPEPVLSFQPVPAVSDISYLDTWHLELILAASEMVDTSVSRGTIPRSLAHRFD